MVQMQLSATQTLDNLHSYNTRQRKTFTCNIVALTKWPAAFFSKTQNIAKYSNDIRNISSLEKFNKHVHKKI